METYLKLTDDQLKRLRLALVESRLAKNALQAKKMTSSWKSCKEQFINLVHWSDASGLEDIAELYVVDDPFDSKPIDEKLDDVPIEHVSDDKPVKRVRGKGKSPSKLMYPVRLENEQLERLKQLGGNVSAHIRAAIDAYLSSKRIDKKRG
ncbi:hypothetical protein [Methylomicrobium lacus]|uniref:hypothetical protein n=1 Tax=Methylomicrobium lacus TaxID=136992 RepID=UPI0035A8D602